MNGLELLLLVVLELLSRKKKKDRQVYLEFYNSRMIPRGWAYRWWLFFLPLFFGLFVLFWSPLSLSLRLCWYGILYSHLSFHRNYLNTDIGI